MKSLQKELLPVTQGVAVILHEALSGRFDSLLIQVLVAAQASLWTLGSSREEPNLMCDRKDLALESCSQRCAGTLRREELGLVTVSGEGEGG